MRSRRELRARGLSARGGRRLLTECWPGAALEFEMVLPPVLHRILEDSSVGRQRLPAERSLLTRLRACFEQYFYQFTRFAASAVPKAVA